MKKKFGKRALALLLTLSLCLCLLPGVFAAEEPLDKSDAMSAEAVKALLNSAELHPQKTGYKEFDNLLEKILLPYQGSDNYTKIRAMYDWTMRNISYSWEGYSQAHAPAYDKFTLTYNLTYDEDLKEAIPKEVIYRSYHALTARKGVCYDYAALFAVMARYVGIEAYVHTGIFKFEDWAVRQDHLGLSGHHGWTELKIGGKNYIFDPQRDCRFAQKFPGLELQYFGISYESAWRYTQEELLNSQRDEGFLPVDAPRNSFEVRVVASPAGDISGAGKYTAGTEVSLSGAGGKTVTAWYTPKGDVLSRSSSYTFTLEKDTVVYGLVGDDCFFDIPLDAWYRDDAGRATRLGIVEGMNSLTFAGEATLTRAMVVEFLSRVEKADTSACKQSPFVDVPKNDWYTASVNWAFENGVIEGTSPTTFAPNMPVTREEFVAMMVRYLNSKGIKAEPGELNYTDAGLISDWARDVMAQAQTLGLVEGYGDGTVHPRSRIIRAEGVTFIMRVVRCLETASAAA